MHKKRNNSKLVIISLSLAAILIFLSAFSFFTVRKIILKVAENQASIIAFNVANAVICEQMQTENYTYDDIVRLTKNSENNISALEIDIEKINHLKSNISLEIANRIFKENEYKISVPIGTLIGSEYTVGFGPRLKFNMQLTANVVTDFESNFYSAGINQVLHQIIIKVDINGGLVLPWNTKGYNTKTSVIAAQTVLVGVVPDAFTNVIEDNNTDSGIAAEIFDYGAEIN